MFAIAIKTYQRLSNDQKALLTWLLGTANQNVFDLNSPVARGMINLMMRMLMLMVMAMIFIMVVMIDGDFGC